jgi:hypothetical protein
MFRREGSRPRPAPRDGKTQSVRQCALPKPLANLLIHYSFHQTALHQFPLSQWLSCITKSAQKLSPRCNSRSESDRKLIIIIRFASGEEGRKPKTATQATSEIWSQGECEAELNRRPKHYVIRMFDRDRWRPTNHDALPSSPPNCLVSRRA